MKILHYWIIRKFDVDITGALGYALSDHRIQVYPQIRGISLRVSRVIRPIGDMLLSHAFTIEDSRNGRLG